MKNNEKHGHTKGGKWSREYRSYQCMRNRCYQLRSGSYARYAASDRRPWSTGFGPGGRPRWHLRRPWAPASVFDAYRAAEMASRVKAAP